MTNNLYEVAKVMGVDEETVKALPKIKFKDNLLNPWGNELPNIFRMLDLTSQKTVLDIPCGQGGVSVHLAKEYGITVDGYDLLQGFIDNANEYAMEHSVQNLCNFFADDIRTAIETGKEYDLVLWSAAPHIWENYKQTVENLRKCVKHNGYIVIADAYLYTDEFKAIQPDYETLSETMKAVTEYGDSIVKLIDYKDTLWAKNYQTDREAVIRAISNSDNHMEKEALKKYLEGINKSEQSDIEHMGLYILVLQVAKSSHA